MGEVLARRLYRLPLLGERMIGRMSTCVLDLRTLGSVLGTVFDELRWCLIGVLNGLSSSMSVDASETVASSSLAETVA